MEQEETIGRDERGQRLLASYLKEVSPGKGKWHKVKAKDHSMGRAILEADAEEQVGVLLATFHLPAARHLFVKVYVVKPLIQEIFGRGITLSEADLLHLCREVVEHSVSDFDFSTKQWLVRYLEKAACQYGLSEPLRSGAALIAASLQDDDMTAGAYRLSAQIQALLHGPAADPLHAEEAWGAAVLADWGAMHDAPRKGAWLDLLTHALNSDASKPSSKWLKDVGALLDVLDSQAARAQVCAWLEKYLTTPLPEIEATGNGSDDYYEHQRLMVLANYNYQAVKGMVWLCRLFGDAPTVSLLGDVALHSLKKIAGHGPKSAKVGTACILTLASMAGPNSITQLSRLKTRVTYQAALGVLDKALGEAAARSGLTRNDLEELAVPSFGLDPDGRRCEQFGGYRGAVMVTGAGKVEVLWTGADGETVKSVPPAIRREHADAVKSLKRTITDLQEAWQTQRDRLEASMQGMQTWPLHVWRARYLTHPLLGLLSRRLLWRFGGQAGMVWEGRIEDEDGSPLADLPDDTPVQLWHPLASDPDRILAWCSLLEQRSITQPFKQAHREVYLLTDAERETRIYSNRFAAHVLKQHQFSALCRQRGWQYTLQGAWDSHNTPSLPLPAHGLAVAFAVDGVASENALPESSVYPYVTTGAVEFSLPSGDPLPLDQVPPLALSEVMRDVDLFVGVASVGNDPAWADGGPEGRYRDYWQDYAFGDLGETAKTRAAVLARLLPRLKIAPRCRLDGRFLVVRGDLRTYKIHLGSGNILMEPNDQYLCIVPGRGGEDTGDLFLPFEGDRILAIILSKAFLLADDTKIKDATITSQINRAAL